MSNFGQYITNSNLASLRHESMMANSRLQGLVKDLPQEIMREQIALEKFGVTWTKLSGEYKSLLYSIKYYEDYCKKFETRLAPDFNPDGTRIKHKISNHGWAGIILLSLLCSSPFLCLHISNILILKLFGTLIPMIITFGIYNLFIPKPSEEYKNKTQTEIKNYFDSWEYYKKCIEETNKEAEPVIKKLDEVNEICGSGSSWSVKYDFDESERFLNSCI
jgi:hypothetical protein